MPPVPSPPGALATQALATLTPAQAAGDDASELVVPFAVRGQAAGLVVVHGAGRRVFADKEVEALQVLVNQAAVAVRADSSVYVREKDVALARSMLKKAEEEVARITGARVTLTVDTTSFLNEQEHWGGVVLLGMNKQITCENTLANRSVHVFDEQLPTVRYLMFHEAAKF